MIKKLNIKIRKTSDPSLFHDSRADSILLMKVFNEMHDKINELIDENERIKQEILELWQNKQNKLL